VNLYIRLLKVLALWLLKPRIGLYDEASVRLRTWPFDLDLNGHMNNGRYLTLMDLGRISYMLRTGMLIPLLKRRWFPVLAAAQIRFRRSLLPFQAFELKTRLVAWDDKWCYMEQRFEVDGHVMAIGYVQALFRSRKGNVPSTELLALIGKQGEVSPPIPEAFK
jgi:acyl-CoA thioesterase FadM